MTALAMKQEGLRPAAKIVLYWLSDHHNGETGLCCPSLSTLAKECEMNKATVARHLTQLEEMGLIIRQERHRSNGSQTSSEYGLSMKQPVANRDTPCRKITPPPVAKTNPHNLGNNNLGSEIDIYTPENDSDLFDEFWARYPRKVGKGSARKAYEKAMKVISHDDLMFALSERYDGLKVKGKYTPHAATWLNGERWEDEIEQPDSLDGREHSDTHSTNRAIDVASRARRAPQENIF